MEKKTVIGFIALLVCGIAALFVMKSPEKGQRQGPRERPVAVVKPADIAHIEVTTQKQEKVSLDKTGDKWQLKTPIDWPADAAAVKALTDGFEKLAFADLVTQSADKQAEFGVQDGKAPTVTIKDASGKVLADLVIGKTVGAFTMVRVAKTNDVWQETGLPEYAVNKEPKLWRDHSIFEFAAADADKLSVEAGANKIVLEKEKGAPDKDGKPGEGKWKIAAVSGNAPKLTDTLDTAQVTGVVQALSTLKGNDFADDKQPEAVGLDKPLLTLTVDVAGKPRTLLIGQTVGEDTYVKDASSKTVMTMKKFALDAVAKRPVDYRDKTLIKAKESDIAEIDITTQGQSWKLVSNGGGKWTSPSGALDDRRLRSVVSAFDNLQGGSFADERDPAKTGLNKPTGSVTLLLKDKSTVTIKVGGESADKSEYYVQKVGSPDIYLAKKYVVDRFVKKPADLAKPAPPKK